MLIKIVVVLLVITLNGDKMPLEKLKSAPEQIEINGRKYSLETYLWRDFMPISPPDGKPLKAIVRVTAVDHQPFPADLIVDQVWVINEGEVWEKALPKDDEQRQAEPYQLERLAIDGPKWKPGSLVDVVVRIIDRSGNSYLLKASKQKINRTS